VPSWQSMGGPELERDRCLILDAQRWLALLPEYARPRELCSTYPRIANRFTMIWANRAAMKSYFDDLLIDKRGGRIGFSPEIKAELVRLRVFYETAMGNAQAVRDWKAQMKRASETPPSAPPKGKE